MKINPLSKSARKQGEKRKAEERGEQRIRTRSGVLPAQATASSSGVLALLAPVSEQSLVEVSDTLPIAQILASPTRSSKRQKSESSRARKVLIDSSSSSSEMVATTEALPKPEVLALPETPASDPVIAPVVVESSWMAQPSPDKTASVEAKGKGVAADPEDNLLFGFPMDPKHSGLPLEASALHNPPLAKHLFNNILLPADANEVLAKPLGEVRMEALENFYRMALQMNWLFESTESQEKELVKERLEMELLRESIGKADDAALRAKKEVEGLQQTIADGEEMYKKSQAISVSLQQQVETLQFSLETARANETRLEKELGEARVVSDRERQEATAVIKAAEEKAREAGISAETAVTRFRSSEECEKDKIDFSIAAYEDGIEWVKKKVAAQYPDLEWGFLYEGGVSDEEDENEDPTPENVPPPAEI